MTKVRHPTTFADAVTRIAGRITWAGAADATGKSERAVRAWSDPETDRCPCIEDCLRLDAAYLRAGGGEAPMLAVYQARLERAAAPPADCAELAGFAATAAKETGEALAALFAAAQPGAAPSTRMIAEREVEEAEHALADARARLGAIIKPLRVA